MLTEERRARIAAELAATGTVVVGDLAARFDVSVITIRRDLAAVVAASPQARRVRGGAVLEPAEDGPVPRARGSRSSRPDAAAPLVGIVVPARDYYYRAVVDGAHEEADRLGLRLLLGVSDYSNEDEVTLVERMLARDVDALLVTPARTHADARIHGVLAQARVPVVLIERAVPDPFGGIDSVHTDHTLGMVAAVRHLIAEGHDRIGLVMRPRNPTGTWLRAGLALAHAEPAASGRHTFEHTLGPGTGEEYAASVRDLLDQVRGAGRTAVVVLSDHEAVDVAEAAISAGLRIPQDLALVAYDDERAADAVVPLTAVAPPKRDLGRLAVRLCADRLRERDSPSGPAVTSRREVLLPTLRVRASTVG